MMLQAALIRANGETSEYHALNDICVIRNGLSKLVSLELAVNGAYMDTYRSDGVIICTPTGSTAYNLSAGGPILKPDNELIGITPICPHALYARPSVVAASDEVRLRLHRADGQETVLVVDGQNAAAFGIEDTLIIRKSEQYTTLLKTDSMGFYDILRRKMVQSK